mmetsp:Transcript_1958/g.3132  ORF Transcript_1958/g.3132 Transcript_1958/m.3132 type:complete len:87 (+) Transcript_1958:416-676(+)
MRKRQSQKRRSPNMMRVGTAWKSVSDWTRITSIAVFAMKLSLQTWRPQIQEVGEGYPYWAPVDTIFAMAVSLDADLWWGPMAQLDV